MSVADLFNGQLDRYFSEQIDHPTLLWLFLHIPKTAGSSFRMELAERLKPDANIHADHRDTSRRTQDSLQDALDRFLNAMPDTRFRFASGHLRRPHVDQIVKAYPDTRLVTMLRDPVARVISDYRYMRTPAHPTYQQVIERYPRFEDYLADPATHNKMFKFLRRSPKDSVAEVITGMEREFAFIGTQEQYALSCKVLFHLLGVDGEPKVHARRTEARPENEIPDQFALEARVAELNSLDVVLYQHFSRRLTRIEPRLRSLLTDTPTTPSTRG